MTIEELIDKAINEKRDSPDGTDKEIEKRKPKPFRYLTDDVEIQEILSVGSDEINKSFSVMKPPSAPKIIDNQLNILGLGDMETVENVLRRHEMSRKFKD